MPQDATLRGFISLGLLLHLLCVAIGLGSNITPSELQDRVTGTLAPYLQLLHFHPGFARFQFTDGSAFGDDHYLRLESPAGELVANLPSGEENRWGLERRRLATLAVEVASYVDRDDLAAHLARSVGAKGLRDFDRERLRVRCLHHASQPMDLAFLEPEFPKDDPTAPAYFLPLYEAEVWIDEDREINLQKRSVGRNAAPSSSATTTPP